MEEDQERKFVCKICSKSFFSGKSLGGHMRGHLAAISAKKREDHNVSNMGLEVGGDTGYGLRENSKKVLRFSDSTHRLEKLKNSDMDLEGGCHASYGLRENPKKSWRVSDSKHSIARKENDCKQCGKEFPSLRALSGHMRCHSTKDREHLCKQCGKGFDSDRALFGHMRHHSKRSRVSNESAESQSDYETARPIRRKRSRMRYKITGKFSEIDEIEEAAMCLMMLSRGVRSWVQFNSVLESSENNSENFEAKALHQIKGIDGKLVCDADETCKMKKVREKLDSCVSCSGNSSCEKNEPEFGDLDSGFMSNNEKKAELGVSVDGFHKGDEFKKPVLDDESAIESSDAEIENGSEPAEVELAREVRLDQADPEMMKSKLSNTSEEASFDVQDPELGGNCFDGINYAASTSGIFEESQKKCEYSCRTCNKIFHSYRALGGHRASHKTITSVFVEKIESHGRSVETNLLLNNAEANTKLEKLECNENSVEQDIGGAAMTCYELKTSKDHECPVCFKVFPSGQALGGHKRAHYIGFSENKTKESMVTKQELPEIHTVFDLNLPVTLEKEVNEDVGFKPWWVGSDHEREPLVISN